MKFALDAKFCRCKPTIERALSVEVVEDYFSCWLSDATTTYPKIDPGQHPSTISPQKRMNADVESMKGITELKD